jgi:hypothetical protein
VGQEAVDGGVDAGPIERTGRRVVLGAAAHAALDFLAFGDLVRHALVLVAQRAAVRNGRAVFVSTCGLHGGRAADPAFDGAPAS